MMKRVIALLLLLAVMATSAWMFGGCSAPDEEDLGAEVSMFFVGEVYDFDPAKAYTNDDAMKVLSLIYEPLFTLDANGNVQYALACNHRFFLDYDGGFKLEITLRNTCWTDGTQVTADDVAYAWKRILSPDFPCQAATLLYDIKNARDVKMNNGLYKDDVAVDAQNDVLTIEFEEELSPERQQNFLRNLTSIALTPVKESAVSVEREDIWSKRVAYIVTNGPFSVRVMDYSTKSSDLVEGGHEFRLERNDAYRRYAGEETSGAEDLYVTPYQFLSYWNTELTDVFTQFVEGSIFYAGDIPLEKREEYLSQARITNLLSTYTYVLDCTDPAFEDARVRRALSLVLDRALIAAATKNLGVAATGFVSHGVFEGNGGSFASVTAQSAAAIKASAAFEEAVALLEAAIEDGYEGGDINILIRDNEEEIAIAKLVVEAWEDLFGEVFLRNDVRYTAQSYETFEYKEREDDKEYMTLYKDAVQEAFRVFENTNKSDGFAGYNVVGIDYQMLSTDAFAPLASFATELSGNGLYLDNLNPENTAIRLHASGFTNSEYDAKIDAAYAEQDMAKRAALLHEAEALLLEEMPAIPLLFNRSAVLISGELTRVYADYYGYSIFTRAELRNYHNHLFPVKEQ